VKWPGKSLLDGCITEAGCLDNSPAVEYMRKVLLQFPDGFKRRISLGSGNVVTGNYETFT